MVAEPGAMDEKIQVLEREVTQLQVSLGQVTEAFNADKVQFMDSVQKEFTTHKLALEQVVMAAREEFQKMNSAMQDLNDKLGIAMTDIERRLKDRAGKGEARASHNRGYIPWNT